MAERRTQLALDVLRLFAHDLASGGNHDEKARLEHSLALHGAVRLAYDALGTRADAGPSDPFGHGKTDAIDGSPLRVSLHQSLGGKIAQNVNGHAPAHVPTSLSIRLIIKMVLLDRNEFHVLSFALFEVCILRKMCHASVGSSTLGVGGGWFACPHSKNPDAPNTASGYGVAEQRASRHLRDRRFYVYGKRRLSDDVRSIGESLSALCTSSLENVSAVCSLHSLTEAMLFLSLTLLRLIGSEHFSFLLVR